MEDNDIQGVANLDRRDMVGMIYVGDSLYCYILSISCGPRGYRK